MLRPRSSRMASSIIVWSLGLHLLVAFYLIRFAPSPSPHSPFGLVVRAQSSLSSAQEDTVPTPPPVPVQPALTVPAVPEQPSVGGSQAWRHAQHRAQPQHGAEQEQQAQPLSVTTDGAAGGAASMRTTLRLCPAAAGAVVHPWTSEWMHPVASRVERFAGSVDGRGVRTLSSSLPSSLTTGPQLRLGTGYGLPHHESAEWQTVDWAAYARQQEEARAARERPPFTSFNPDPPALQSRLDWLQRYDYQQPGVRQAELPERYPRTSAPWYELELRDAEGVRHRLLILEAEWLIPASPHREGLWATTGDQQEADTPSERAHQADAHSLVDGVSLLVVLMPEVGYYDTVNVSVFDIPFSNDALAGRLFPTMRCAFTADSHEPSNSPLFSAARDAVEAISGAEQLPVVLEHNPLWKGVSHHLVHCPLPHLSPHQRSLLSAERSAGPPVSLTSLTLSVGVEEDVAAFGFRSLSVPLCLLRSRRVSTTVILSSQLGPPHMLRPSQLHDFLAYYTFLGVQRFHIPDRYGSLLPSLLPYMAQGLISYTRQPFLTPHHQPYLDQVPVLAASLMRERLLADWVLSVDVDEFLTLDHPYWTEGAGVRPPDEHCWPRAGQRLEEAQPCRSMLGDFLTQPGMDELSMLVLSSVPHWGMPAELNGTLTSLYAPPNVGLPVSAALSALAPYHPLDVWSRRSHAAEFHRFKCLFRPAHVQFITMHDVTANRAAAQRGLTPTKVEGWHKYWGDSALQRHKEHILSHSLLEDDTIQFHPDLSLHALLCSDAQRRSPDVQRSFALSCCAEGPTVSNACFVATEGFDPYALARLTPLFPTVAQSNPKSSEHLLLPVKLPVATYPLPLALFGLHISHLFCMFLHPRVWPTCTTAQLTWNKGPMWGESKRDGIAFDAEEDDDRAKVRTRTQLREWMDSRVWADHSDMRGFEARKTRWMEQRGGR